MSTLHGQEPLSPARGDVWVIVETGAEGVCDGSTEALQEGAALSKQIGYRLCAVLPGKQTHAIVQLLQGRNIAHAYCLEHSLLAPYATDFWVAALAHLTLEFHPTVILMSGTTNGLDLAPRLAARIRAPLVNGCVIVRAPSQDEIECVVPTHQDKVYTTYTSSTSEQPLVATLRPGAIGVESPFGQDQPTVTVIHPEIDEIETRVQIVEHIPGDPGRMDLHQSERIIAGGRGMADMSGWALVQEAANALNASPAGSRKALDMGLLPRERLIGLSGKSVSPKHYIAAGISGDHFHLRAVETEHLIAINTDPKAPIFKQAKLGILGNLHEILPILTAKLRARHR